MPLTPNSGCATVPAMASWTEFTAAAPRLAERVQQLLYQFGVGLGYLGTVDTTGAPRVHPLCPIICGGELYLLVVPGPKCNDLHRDGRFALHSFPRPDDEPERHRTDPQRQAIARSAQHAIPGEDHLGRRHRHQLRNAAIRWLSATSALMS